MSRFVSVCALAEMFSFAVGAGEVISMRMAAIDAPEVRRYSGRSPLIFTPTIGG